MRVIADVIVKDAGEKRIRRRYGRVVANCDIASLSANDQRHLCEVRSAGKRALCCGLLGAV